MCNSTDSDGDGLFLINLSLRGVNEEEAKLMNNHFMGMRGYTYVYGEHPSQWPCAEFSSYGDKHGKKALVSNKMKAYVTRKDAAWYLSASSKVSSHYRGAVGIAYGICSVLTFKAADYMYAREAGFEGMANAVKLYERTLAVVWRLLYEGLGLAGYTVNAKKFFDILAIAVWKTHYTLDEQGNVIRATAQTSQDNLLPCLPALVECLGISHLKSDIALAIVRLIIEAETIRQNRGALERGKSRVQYMSVSDVETAAIFTGLRAIGQGKDNGGIAELTAIHKENNEDDVIPTSLFSVIDRLNLTERLHCPWLAELLKDGTYIHQVITNHIFDDMQAQEEMVEQPQA